MYLEIVCDKNLNIIFYIVKNILNLIMIIVPILLIIFGSILFIKLVKNPEEKNGIKKIINQFIAASIIFFIPLLVNVVMGILGNQTSLSSCWVNAKKGEEVKYHSTDDQYDKQSILLNPKDYESGVAKLDFSCTSSVVKAQFSCDTLKIVEKHLYDFDVNNFDSIMTSQGGYKNYIKSLGGIFSKYADFNGKITTITELQEVSEYVWGIMTMYGFDYANNQAFHYGKWGDQKGTDYGAGTASADAYYPTGVNNGRKENKISSTIDEVASGNGVGMTTNCALGVQWVYRKAGILPSDINVYQFQKLIENGGKIITNASELKPGDMIHYFRQTLTEKEKRNPSIWWDKDWYHIDLVGERDEEKKAITLYDSGHYYTNGRNYKLVRKIGEKPYPSAKDWLAIRIHNFES